jgi:hypothetical protein
MTSDTMPLFGAGLQSSAVLSPCGTYRYELTRRWSDRPLVGWIMLNPSTADADVDDPTVRRCIGFAKTWGYGGLIIRNLFALRATDPSELEQHADPIGPDNDAHLAQCQHDTLTLVAWGARGGRRGRDVLTLLATHGVRPCRLAVTGNGQPRHPLYLKAGLVPIPLPQPALAGGDR